MDLSDDQRHDLDVALNEATLLGAEVDAAERRAAALTFSVLSLPPDDGPPPPTPGCSSSLAPLGGSPRRCETGGGTTPTQRSRQFGLDRLLEVVMSFKGMPVYGWEFVDRPEADKFATWSDRLSLDWRSGPDGMSHTLDVFQEGYDRHLDLRIWFDELRVFTPEHEEIALDDFAAGGVRWWDGLYANDPRTAGHGIAPLAGNGRTGGR